MTTTSIPHPYRQERKEYPAPWLKNLGGERYLRQVNVLRFVLPILLAIVSTGFELYEHWGVLIMDIQLAGEILFFGLLGPLMVFAWLSYIGLLVRKLNAANRSAAQLNQSLEQQVAERTAALAARNLDLAKVNAELATANQELQKLDQLKSDFVALVSHELRAPLTTLNGALEITLRSECELPPRARRVIEVMSTESERLTHFVQTILDLSRLEAGKVKFNPGLLSLKPMLTRIADATVCLNGRNVNWQFEPQLPPAWVDEIYLEEVIKNILVNADKYSPAGAPVAIAVHRSRSHANMVAIDVVDHGPGIPPAQQQQIFERFYRQDTAEHGTTPGWGLGLFFARALVEGQGGRLSVTSPVRADAHQPGTCFTVTLPLAEEEPTDD
jgi:signal transduction histidine kinase